MRRTFIGAAALGCATVLLGTVPAFADSAAPTPATTARAAEASPVPSEAPTRAATPVPSAEPSLVAEADPTRAPSRDQVSAVPAGAPDTGVGGTAAHSGSPAAAIGAGAVAALLAGGAGVLVVRRRRATEA